MTRAQETLLVVLAVVVPAAGGFARTSQATGAGQEAASVTAARAVVEWLGPERMKAS